MADLEPARALAARLLELLPGADLPRAVELIEADRATVRESERQACIEYSDRTESMYRARAQAVADDSDRADSEAASDDEERHEMRAEGARAVANGLRKAAHRPFGVPSSKSYAAIREQERAGYERAIAEAENSYNATSDELERERRVVEAAKRLVNAYERDGNGVSVRSCEDTLIAEVKSYQALASAAPAADRTESARVEAALTATTEPTAREDDHG